MTRDEPRVSPWSLSGRIVGGEATTIEETPYQISLQIWREHTCGGSIISQHWVVTAGHCVGYSSNMYTVKAGSTNRTTGGSIHHVSTIVRHEDYGLNGRGVPINDIALIRVVEPFEIDETRQPIALFDEYEASPVGAMARITGWGRSAPKPKPIPEVLQIVSIPIVSKEDCNTAYGNWGGIPENQICAANPEGGKDSCQGDSGGPVAINGRLAGIVSWGNGCAVRGQPGVNTEVSAHRAWIKLNTGV